MYTLANITNNRGVATGAQAAAKLVQLDTLVQQQRNDIAKVCWCVVMCITHVSHHACIGVLCLCIIMHAWVVHMKHCLVHVHTCTMYTPQPCTRAYTPHVHNTTPMYTILYIQYYTHIHDTYTGIAIFSQAANKGAYIKQRLQTPSETGVIGCGRVWCIWLFEDVWMYGWIFVTALHFHNIHCAVLYMQYTIHAYMQSLPMYHPYQHPLSFPPPR